METELPENDVTLSDKVVLDHSGWTGERADLLEDIYMRVGYFSDIYVLNVWPELLEKYNLTQKLNIYGKKRLQCFIWRSEWPHKFYYQKLSITDA